MADNDIYNNKGQYEKFKANLNLYLEEPKGFRKYQIKSRKNLSYFYKLMTRFEAADISYIRRLRLLRSFLIVCHSITRDLAEVDREDIDRCVMFANQQNNSERTKKDFVRDLKHMWKILFPEKDEKGRIDDTIVPYAVRHLSAKMDKSREKMRKDRLTVEEFEKLIGAFGNDPRMQALLTVKIESLGRPQELLGRNIEDVELQENFAKIYISEHGKEGIGFLRSIDSFYYLTKWLNEHPLKHDPKAPLFINLGTRGKYLRLKPSAANKLLRERCKALGIHKPITLYSFKRNGVTLCRLRGDSDMDIQHRARWTSTRQLRTYDLSTQDDSFKIELIKRGMIKPDEKYAHAAPMLKRCTFCGHNNGIAEKVCANCKRLLDRQEIERIEKEKEAENRQVREEMAVIKEQLAQSERRDEIILKLIQGLAKRGKMKDVVSVIKEEGLASELV
ncbi:MAG: site-specific integrase [archaeon]